MEVIIEAKKKLGRPRKYDIPDCVDEIQRNKIRKNISAKTRYRTDEAHRNKIKEQNKMNARAKYNKIKIEKYKLFLQEHTDDFQTHID